MFIGEDFEVRVFFELLSELCNDIVRVEVVGELVVGVV